MDEEISFIVAFFVAGLILIAAVLGVAIVYDNKGKRATAQTMQANGCRLTGIKDGQTDVGTGMGLSASGRPVAVTTVSSTDTQYQYQCNDGITYWKNFRIENYLKNKGEAL